MTTLFEFKKTIKSPLRQATLVFCVRDHDILLAMKKRGFGVGRFNGVGGKVEEGESVLEAARRETIEEIGVHPLDLRQVATLDFYFANIPEEKKWNQQVRVYWCTRWEGEPKESEEMAPQWFPQDQVPFASMWPDDIHWLPIVLKGKNVEGEFLFGDNDAVLDFSVRETKSALPAE